jgi:hypothetical protein
MHGIFAVPARLVSPTPQSNGKKSERERENMRASALVLGIAIAALGVGHATAAMRITADRGGLMVGYATKFMQVRESGEQVVIDGACLSACTMVVGFVPRHRICVTPNAVLGFHAAWRPDGSGGKVTSAAATQALLSVYPAAIRSWIARRGGLTPKMIFLRGRELAAFVPTCGAPAPAVIRRARTSGTTRTALGTDVSRASAFRAGGSR